MAKKIDFSGIIDTKSDLKESEQFKARDGISLTYRTYFAESSVALILIHGSAGNNNYFANLANKLASNGISVYTPDIRGHGISPLKRGDISYIGQLEDDLADFIDFILQSNPKISTILLGGHSSGGGFALRFAKNQYAHKISGYILLAPYLGHNAPTVGKGNEAWVKASLGKIIFIQLLNSIGIHCADDWEVLKFSVPDVLKDTATNTYSYRLMVNFATDNYKNDLRLLNKPLLVLVGEDDEAFIANQYEPTIKKFKEDAVVQIIPGYTHISLVTESEISQNILNWISELP